MTNLQARAFAVQQHPWYTTDWFDTLVLATAFFFNGWF